MRADAAVSRSLMRSERSGKCNRTFMGKSNGFLWRAACIAAEGFAGLHDRTNQVEGPGENVRRASWQCHQEVQVEFFMKERAGAPFSCSWEDTTSSGQVDPTPPLIYNEQTGSG
jgi:hypothetical protein